MLILCMHILCMPISVYPSPSTVPPSGPLQNRRLPTIDAYHNAAQRLNRQSSLSGSNNSSSYPEWKGSRALVTTRRTLSHIPTASTKLPTPNPDTLELGILGTDMADVGFGQLQQLAQQLPVLPMELLSSRREKPEARRRTTSTLDFGFGGGKKKNGMGGGGLDYAGFWGGMGWDGEGWGGCRGVNT